MADAIRVSQWGSNLELQIEGRGTMQQCPTLRHWVEGRLARGANRLRVDLSRCSHLDSTFLGTLLILNRHVLAASGRRAVLSAPSAECLKLLALMHVLEQFDISPDHPGPREWQDELKCEPAGSACSYGFKQNVVEAHQELAQVEGPCAAQFRDLAAQLAQELPAPPQRTGSLHDTIAVD